MRFAMRGGDMRVVCFGVAVLTACALVAGCGHDSSSGTSFEPGKAQLNPQPRENLRDGGTLTTSTELVSPQWNPFHADGTTYTLDQWRWYNPVLAFFTPEGVYSFNRDYLTDVKKTTEDGKTVVTYSINPRATYNDGTPIDWRSFENTWKCNRGTDPAFIVASTAYPHSASFRHELP